MKRFSERKWLLAGFGMASLLVGLVSSISYQNAAQLIESTNKSKQTYEVIKNLVDIFSTMTVAESGRRGYVFLGDVKELFRYQDAISDIKPELDELRRHLADNPDQLKRLSRLEALLITRISIMQQSIELYQMDKSAVSTQRLMTDDSVELRTRIQLLINEMQTQEEKLLQQWLNQSQRNIHDRLLIEFWVTFAGVAGLVIVFVLLYQQLAKRHQAEAVQYNLTKEKELSDLKLRFFSMVSHEFRTPLSVILGSAQLLADGNQAWAEDRRLKSISRIQSSARLMTQLLSDVLMLTRAEAGKLECNPTAIDVEAFCLNLVEDIQLSSPDHTIKLISQSPCTYANLDEKLLYSILTNLLSNAIKYSAAGTVVQLLVQGDAEAMLFQITDQGIGISPEEQQQLYEPFQRGLQVQKIAGTGLGLAVVKKCVELHQGEIFVTSEVGSGTTFTVKIPRGAAAFTKSLRQNVRLR